MRKLLLLIVLLPFYFCVFPQTLEVDSIVRIEKTATFDTVIVKNGGRLYVAHEGTRSWKNMFIINKYLRVDSGGKIIGIGDRGYIAIGSSYFINNAGTDSIENIRMNILGGFITMAGRYPTILYDVMCGWDNRGIILDTTLILNGPIFEGYGNQIYLRGHELVLGSKAFFRNVRESYQPLYPENGQIRVQIQKGINYTLPITVLNGNIPYRTDVNFKLASNSTVNADASVVLAFYSDSVPSYAKGLALKHFMSQFVNIRFVNIPSPILDLNCNAAFNVQDGKFPLLNGNSDFLLNAFWNGSSWLYGNPFNKAMRTMEWKGITSDGTLALGRDFGVNSKLCYSPDSASLIRIDKNSAIVKWTVDSSATAYNIKYRKQGVSTWSILDHSSLITKDTINAIDSGYKYIVKIQSVCASDSALNTKLVEFKTGMPGYRVNANGLISYWVTKPDTLMPDIFIDSLRIRNNGVLQATSNIMINKVTIVENGGSLYLDEFSLKGACKSYVLAGATLRYSSKYISGGEFPTLNAFNNTSLTKTMNQNATYWLNGNIEGGDGQVITNEFPQISKVLRLSGGRVSLNRSSSIMISDKIIFDAGSMRLMSGDVMLQIEGSEFINNVDTLVLDGVKLLFNGNTLLKGAGSFLKTSELLIGIRMKKASLTLEQDVQAMNKFFLDSGKLVLNNHRLMISSIDKTKGHIITNLGGCIEYLIKDYRILRLPFGSGFPNDTATLFFNPINGILGENARFKIEMIDTAHYAKGKAPVDFLKRYVRITPLDITNPIYNVSYKYLSSDINGVESFMENSLYQNAAWKMDGSCIDSVKNIVSWKSISGIAELTAGNFMGFDTAHVTDLKTYDINTSAATVSFKFNDEGVKKWFIYYAEIASSTWLVDSTFSFTKRITALNPGSNYKLFVNTNDFAAYPYIKNSDTIYFTTRIGSCNQPVALQTTQIDTTSIKLKWNEGVSPFKVEYKKINQAWSSALSVSVIIADSLRLYALDSASKYVIRVQSNCASYSDTLLTNTIVHGWDQVNNILYINTNQTISSDFIFNKIIVNSTGIAKLKSNVKYIDSLIVKKYGECIFDTFTVTGFAFVAHDTAKLSTAHQYCFTLDTDNGSVRSKVRNFSVKASYIYNGQKAQYLSDIFDVDNRSNYYVLILDNPISVESPMHGLNIKDNLQIKKGMLKFGPYYKTLSLDANAKLYNYSSLNAINNHRCFMSFAGGAPNIDDAASFMGPNEIWLDSINIKGYGDPSVYAPLRVNKKIKLDISSGSVGYTKGLKIIGATLTLDTGAIITNAYDANLILSDSAIIRYSICMGDIGRTIFIPLGDVLTPRPLTFLLNGASAISNNAKIDFVPILQASSNKDTASSFINYYITIKGEGISDPNFSVNHSYNGTTWVGSEKALYAYVFDGNKWNSFDSANRISKTLVFNAITSWGDFTAISLQDVGIHIPMANSDIMLYPNPSSDYIKVHFEDPKDEVRCELFSAKGLLLFKGDYTQTSDIKINIIDLASGLYFLRISEKNKFVIRRFVKL